MFEKFKSWYHCKVNARRQPILKFDRRVVMIRKHQYVVRQVNDRDISSLVQIEEQIYGKAPWSYAAFQLEIQRPHDRLYLAVVNDGQIIAFMGMAVDWYHLDLHITNIGVTPGYQQHGIGTYLMRTAIAYARYLQLRSLSLEVRVHNLVARKLYEQLGFREHRIKHRYYVDNHEDAVDMQADLLSRGGK
ncbi:ribosomal protein S18-alanine N-acetyltransferase [Limosilactobacillus panis]|jgi:ribosomal-protein-alanine N-acetyltransferase|uniref:ribosomal protein S18-alanine N-acetyltransferase n=1 Tax=Limosilactobacillus panis TaxID=47493 RepID=UPI00064A720B|nr:ribosomal protein S18-alanine N-acetyltransferase [Limosilactobacillus panis]